MIERIEDIYWYDFRYLMILGLWGKVLLFVLYRDSFTFENIIRDIYSKTRREILYPFDDFSSRDSFTLEGEFIFVPISDEDFYYKISGR